MERSQIVILRKLNMQLSMLFYHQHWYFCMILTQNISAHFSASSHWTWTSHLRLAWTVCRAIKSHRKHHLWITILISFKFTNENFNHNSESCYTWQIKAQHYWNFLHEQEIPLEYSWGMIVLIRNAQGYSQTGQNHWQYLILKTSHYTLEKYP